MCARDNQLKLGRLPPPKPPAPFLLEKSEGERRIWRDPPPGGSILKVSPENNGSQHLVLGAEDVLTGDMIPRHKHLGQDEIVVVQSGVVHVQVGDQERDLHAGGMAFIPAYTWVSLKGNDTQPASIVFAFSAPVQQSFKPSRRQELLQVVDTLKIYPFFSQDPLDLAALGSCRLLVKDDLGGALHPPSIALR